jgi:peroxiredoxin
MMAAVAVLAAGGGYMAARRVSPAPGQLSIEPSAPTATDNGSLTAGMLGQRRPDFTLVDAAGRTVTADAFDGQIVLVNFWATWCTPCVEEMPMLSRLQRDHAGPGFTVVGIAVDEPQRAQEFARSLQLEYTVLFGLPEAMLAGRRYGNGSGMLPYSVLVDSAGVIRWTRLGALEREQLEAQLQRLGPARG